MSGKRALRIVLAICLLVLGSSLSNVARADSRERVIEFAPSAVGYTNLLRPYKNYAEEDHLSVSRSQYHAYVAYDTSSLSPSDTIVSAALNTLVSSSEATEPGLQVGYTAGDWTEGELTHANRPEPISEVVDADDAVVPAANSMSVIELNDLSTLESVPKVGFALTYAGRFDEIRLAKSAPPLLRLRVRSGPGPTINSKTLPYEVAPSMSTDRKVFAHYFPPYPISLDNQDPASDYYAKHYLSPNGEEGKFKAQGGLLRDRPPGRPPIAGNYELIDASSEVAQAADAGIDGFTIDILSWSGDLWRRTLTVAQAADARGGSFVTVPNLDATSAATNAPIPTIAAKLAEFYTHASAYRLADGRYVLSSFKAEGKPADWWQRLILELKNTHGISVAFIGVMLELSDETIAAFAPISYALSIWGPRSPSGVATTPDIAGRVHRAGVKWMAPVAVQDVRHQSLIYAEAGNTETLRASWARAEFDRADLVQMITWNDYSESTHFAPSVAHGNAFLDVNGYFATQFKTGMLPVINSDELVVSHRVQQYGNRPTVQRTSMSSRLSSSTTRPRDTVEVITMLQAPALITVRVGSTSTTFDAPAGFAARTVPLVPGRVGAEATRNGQIVTVVNSPHRVRSTVERWDLQYYAHSSRETGV